MGRSPTQLIDMLKAVLGHKSAIKIPLSGMDAFEPEGVRRFNSKPYYSDKAVAKLRTHLDEFMPKEAELGGRKILLIDFSEKAKSITNAVREISVYLKRRNPTHPTQMKAVAIPQDAEAALALGKQGIEILKVPRTLWKRMVRGQYRNLAEYEQFPLYNIKVRPEYERPELRTRASMQARLKKNR